MGYEKRIVYFDLIENEEKIGNAGFAKIIIQNGQMRLTLNIKGLHKAETIRGEIMLLQMGASVLLDFLQLKNGKCTYSCLFTKEMLQEKNVDINNVYGMRIRINEVCYLKALWEKEPVPVTEKREKEDMLPTVLSESKEETEVSAVPSESKAEIEVSAMPEAEKNCYQNAEQIVDDKWKQLERIFPHLHPFGDEREYLSITPKDFIVLTKEFQCLANNSFLLHGYYNYRHIILGKIIPRKNGRCEEESERYYLGVPGVYYEREKAVALMFGFESFECAKEPAQTGTFGYYMKRVEI